MMRFLDARRCFALAIAIAVLPALADAQAPAAGARSSERDLVRYDFDDDLSIESGPDTFRVYRATKGTVEITSAYRRSGERSLMLRDVPGDGHFPELQGYLPLRRTGRLFMRLSFLVANPDQELNIALAGPNWFRLEKDGISFWLKTEGGILRHVSDGMPKRLFKVDPFVWYTADVAFDLVRGRYDLKIRREGESGPMVDLNDQPSAHGAVEAGIDKFSIVGSPFDDESSVVFFVDDVAFGVDEALVLPPFAAPGRRKLFVDRVVELRAALKARPTCPALSSYGEIGMPDPPEAGVLLEAFRKWRRGCEALDGAAPNPVLAAALFSMAIEAIDAPVYRMSRAVARAAGGRLDLAWEDAEAARAADPFDPRAVVVSGLVAYAKGRTAYGTELWREALANLDRMPDDRPAREDLAERLFYSLLWQERCEEAGEFARARAESASSPRDWVLRRGDALFLCGQLDLSRGLYSSVRSGDWDPEVLERLSDIAFKQGDLAAERRYREEVYGSLHPR